MLSNSVSSTTWDGCVSACGGAGARRGMYLCDAVAFHDVDGAADEGARWVT